MEDKTNVMRILDKKKVPYTVYSVYSKGLTLEDTVGMTSVDTARLFEIPPDRIFKTLVTVGKSSNHYVFVVPSDRELDLKKSAKVVGEKSIAMVKSKELLPLTGYVHGGCSPIGMKKFFTTHVHETAQSKGSIVFSAGRVGTLVEVSVEDIPKVIRVSYADLVVEV